MSWPEPNKPGKVLPSLRGDLRFVEGAPSHDGSPTWVVVDPVRGKYYQIGWDAYQMLLRWNGRSAEAVLSEVRAETTSHPANEDLDALVLFLYNNHLLRDPPIGGFRAYASQAEAARPGWLSWLLHHYLFLQIPLVRPDRYLRATLPYVEWLFSRPVALAIALLGVVGLQLASRQWEAFTTTFLHFFTPLGFVSSVLCLILVKICHELGHAYTAVRYGCRVPTMGMAMVVMVPMLYSDTSDAWKLKSRYKRVAIGAAGMIVECSLAALAIFAWNFLGDGMMKSFVFIMATTSLLTGLGINLSPLMRFDGYYVLADWLGMPNLHDRASAFGKWKLRQWLFGIDVSMPEPVSPARCRFLVWFAWATWAYRLTLFLAIAFVVYQYFFKALGIILFAVEIGWFIVLPIAHEVKAWWSLRPLIAERGRIWVSGGVLAVLTVLLFVPWSDRVRLPAVLESTPHATLYAPEPGRIVGLEVGEGRRVAAGETLVVLESPALEKDMAVTRKRIEVEQLKRVRQFADQQELTQHQVTVETLKAHLSQLEGLQRQQQNLSLITPIAGVVVDKAEALHVGRWINKDLPLAYVIDPDGEEVHAVVPETDVGSLRAGQQARFIPEGPERPVLRAQIVQIRDIDESTFIVPYLASLYGGAVPVREDVDRKMKPETSVYRVTLQLVEPSPQWNQAVRGTVLVEGPRISLARRLWEEGARVLIRESGV